MTCLQQLCAAHSARYSPCRQLLTAASQCYYSTMASFTNEEYADIHLTYGLADGRANVARQLYHERFPSRRLPSAKTFYSVDRRLREYGACAAPPGFSGRGRPSTYSADDEENVLQTVAEDRTISTRSLATAVGMSQSTVMRVLHRNHYHPFRMQKVQALLPEDYQRRLDFCNFILRRQTHDQHFSRTILFTDEAYFSKEGIVNSHNWHEWAEENPHSTVIRGYQQRCSVNIWCGIIDHHLIGPHVLPHRLTGERYLRFLDATLPELLEDVSLASRMNLWYMHDGAPAHFSGTVRRHLDNAFPSKWIGRGGPVAWPARSPDLNPLDFFLWGHLKSVIYEGEVDDVNTLQRRIQHACDITKRDTDMMDRVQQSFLRRVQLCHTHRGRHFEQYL